MIHQSFPSEIHKKLDAYVYIYVDTSREEEKIIYVGKGRGNRCFAHLKSEGVDEKSKAIRKLSKAGCLRIELLAFGLDDKTALKVEAAAIDLVGLDYIFNKQAGHRSAELGRVLVDDLIARLTLHSVNQFKDDCLLIRINHSYRVGMSALELYESTRGVWKVGPDRNLVRYALAIYQGVVQEVYCIKAWFEAGSTFYGTREDLEDDDRWEFVGAVADDEVRNRYLFHSVREFLPDGAQNPIAYFGPSFKKQ